ncbi:hypothetical protein DICVIV_04854 [Dictyocaulus viviparus]|uniref:Uncharacterized protein n=1 Tax=Dictyocaulus viviparus TaxID=29172 RepID=A0A0D8Y364_DICVI|nr:hypothetical protein DICVIV_04854 [Dictyocaulus viviparus]
MWRVYREIHSIVDDLSMRLGTVGDEWLSSSQTSPKYFEFTSIELHAITERLQLPEPTASGALIILCNIWPHFTISFIATILENGNYLENMTLSSSDAKNEAQSDEMSHCPRNYTVVNNGRLEVFLSRN